MVYTIDGEEREREPGIDWQVIRVPKGTKTEPYGMKNHTENQDLSKLIRIVKIRTQRMHSGRRNWGFGQFEKSKPFCQTLIKALLISNKTVPVISFLLAEQNNCILSHRAEAL